MAIVCLRAPTYGRIEQATVSSAPYHQSRGWEETKLLYGEVGAEDGRKQSVCTEESERRMGGIGSFVWCDRRKVYRLSENTL